MAFSLSFTRMIFFLFSVVISVISLMFSLISVSVIISLFSVVFIISVSLIAIIPLSWMVSLISLTQVFFSMNFVRLRSWTLRLNTLLRWLSLTFLFFFTLSKEFNSNPFMYSLCLLLHVGEVFFWRSISATYRGGQGICTASEFLASSRMK